MRSATVLRKPYANSMSTCRYPHAPGTLALVCGIILLTGAAILGSIADLHSPALRGQFSPLITTREHGLAFEAHFTPRHRIPPPACSRAQEQAIVGETPNCKVIDSYARSLQTVEFEERLSKLEKATK